MYIHVTPSTLYNVHVTASTLYNVYVTPSMLYNVRYTSKIMYAFPRMPAECIYSFMRKSLQVSAEVITSVRGYQRVRVLLQLFKILHNE